MPVIDAPFETMKKFYPFRPNLTPELKRFMDSITGTPCCVQVSHALNMAGELIGPKNPGARRTNNAAIPAHGTTYYYVLAVDELENWLTVTYGDGEEVHVDEDGLRRTPAQIKASLQGRRGVLLFRDPGQAAGFHTELWDGAQIVQRDMNEHVLFTRSRVLFWDAGPALWLTTYMKSW
jgi:Type VI secretion system (T6SS), amidase effector protein 4